MRQEKSININLSSYSPSNKSKEALVLLRDITRLILDIEINEPRLWRQLCHHLDCYNPQMNLGELDPYMALMS